jgi:hypothetical protein
MGAKPVSQRSGQQYRSDLLAHFLPRLLPWLVAILSGPEGAGTEPLDPKSMQAREPVPAQTQKNK